MGRVYRFGEYELNAARRLLLHRSAPVPITARAFDILLVLLEARHRVVEKDELLSRVWPDQVVEEGNLSQQIFVLRRLLGSEQYIVTVPRRGYQFVAPVDEVAAPAPREIGATAGVALRLDVVLDPPIVLGPNPALAVSRDGSLLVYVGEHDNSTALFARRLGAYETRIVAGTAGAAAPFFSPDARWIGYAANGRLQRTAVDGGTAVSICDVDGAGRGASWGLDNRIVFAPVTAGPLFVVGAAGGTPRPLTRLDYAGGERSHRFPSFTSDGRHVLFTVSCAGDASFDQARLAVASAESGAHRVMLAGASCGAVTGPSRLSYQRAGVLFVTEFDESGGTSARPGEPVEAVATHEAGAAHAVLLDSGLLVYAPAMAPAAPARVLWRDVSGAETTIEGIPGLPEEPRISPDGGHLVVGVRAETSDLWLYDFERRTLARLTESGDNFAAIWTPDGRAVVFSSNRGGPSNLYRLAIGAFDAAASLLESPCEHVPGAWTGDGTTLLFTQYDADSGASLWRLDGGGRADRLMHSRFNDYAPAVSPDDRWLAYTSDASGAPEIYILRYPELDGRHQVSRGGGSEPVWAPRSHRLYFRTGVSLCFVEIDNRGRATAPCEVAPDRYRRGSPTGLPNYDVHPDGRLLLIAPPEVARTRTHLRAVVPSGTRR